MNSVVLAQLVASTVMAGELSLMAAQVSGDLVSAHEKLGHILGMGIMVVLMRREGVMCLLETEMMGVKLPPTNNQVIADGR